MISVVIPTRHRDDLLSQCLDCLAQGVQTLPAERYEVIVTDDGSTSTAAEMIARRYPWARWVAGPRRGPASNRNNGARAARGDFLAFTDDDCRPAPQWLEAFEKAIRDRVDVYEGKTTCVAGVKSPMQGSPANLAGGWLWSCNMMARKSLFDLMNGFYEGFPLPHMEDTDFRERLKARGLPFVFVSDAVVDHPPRRMLFGGKRARLHECDIILDRVWNRPPKSLGCFLRNHAKNRLREVIKSSWGPDSLVAIISAVVESAALARDYPRWLRKYPEHSLRPHEEAQMTQSGQSH